MPELNVMRGDELPIQLHRGTYPSLGDIVSVWDSWEHKFWLHPDHCGFWTTSFDPVLGTALWALVPLRKKHGAAEAGYRQTDHYRNWQLTPKPDARLMVVDSVGDYRALIAEFGYTIGGQHFSVDKIDYERLALCYDGLRVTDAGVRAAGQWSQSPLSWWGGESTLWFTGCFTEIKLFDLPEDLPEYVLCQDLHDEDQAAVQLGFALPDAFHPEIDSGYLTIPVLADPEDNGLMLQLSRLCLKVTGFGPVWYETDDREDQEELHRSVQMLAVVEIQNRRATGFAVVVDTDSWGECAVDAKQCAVGRHYAVPTAMGGCGSLGR